MDLKCSADNKRAKWDLGGQWVTDTQENITRLLNEFNLETYVQFDSGTKVLDMSGKVYTFASTPNVPYASVLDKQLMISKINSNAAKISSLKPFENIDFAKKLDSMNFDQWLFTDSFDDTSKAMLAADYRTFIGLELNQLNALFGLTYIKSAGSYERLELSSEGCAQEKKIKGNY